MVQQVKFRRAPGGFNHLPLPGRGGGNRLTLLELMQPLGINQLFEMGQTLEAIRRLQGIA
ncbi:hypothetical protein D3C75_1221120 [compost metagenome]